MKTTSKYSRIAVIAEPSIVNYQKELIIIQIEKIENYFIVEFVPTIYERDYINEQPKQQISLAEQNKREQLENEYNDALEIVLNNDPQGKWSGCTLAEILAKDIEWFKWAKSDMRNPYIKKFVGVICEHDNIK